LKECPVDRAATPRFHPCTVNRINIADRGGIPVTAFQNDVMVWRRRASGIAAELPY
jgi:hypothetical protein